MTDNKDTWYCYDCQSLVPDGEHLPAHHRCQGIGEDFVAAICAELRKALVRCAIPLEALQMAYGQPGDTTFHDDMKLSIAEAIESVRSILAKHGGHR